MHQTSSTPWWCHHLYHRVGGGEAAVNSEIYISLMLFGAFGLVSAQYISWTISLKSPGSHRSQCLPPRYPQMAPAGVFKVYWTRRYVSKTLFIPRYTYIISSLWDWVPAARHHGVTYKNNDSIIVFFHPIHGRLVNMTRLPDSIFYLTYQFREWLWHGSQVCAPALTLFPHSRLPIPLWKIM